MTGHPGEGQHVGPVQSHVPLPQGGARRAPGGSAPLQPRIHETSVKRLLGCEAVHPHSRLPPASPPDMLCLKSLGNQEMLVSVTGVFSDGVTADCRLSPALLVRLGIRQACACTPLLLPQVSIPALGAHSPRSHQRYLPLQRLLTSLFPPVPVNQM